MTRWRRLYYKTRERWNVFNTDFYCLRFAGITILNFIYMKQNALI